MTGSDPSAIEAVNRALQWFPDPGVGYFPADPAQMPYDDAYHQHYVQLASTAMGAKLTEARIRMVARYYPGPVVDVGIGAGQFCLARPQTKGYDVNPAGVRWLKDKGLWHDFAAAPCEAATFWDALEHIPDPAAALAKVSRWVFVSLPMFYSRSHILKSKHFKPHEHIWYWTREGFRRWAQSKGFAVREENAVEMLLGREEIHSFVLERVSGVAPALRKTRPLPPGL